MEIDKDYLRTGKCYRLSCVLWALAQISCNIHYIFPYVYYICGQDAAADKYDELTNQLIIHYAAAVVVAVYSGTTKQ